MIRAQEIPGSSNVCRFRVIILGLPLRVPKLFKLRIFKIILRPDVPFLKNGYLSLFPSKLF